MRVLMIAASAVILAGCATPKQIDNAQQMRDREPRVAFSTSKSPDDAQECVRAGMSAVAKSGHNVGARDEGENRVVWITALGNPVLSVLIAPNAEGSSVEYRSRFKAGSGHYTNAVLACR